MDSELFIITTLDSLSSQKGKSYFDLWLKWEDLFSQIHVPIYIFTLKSENNKYIPSSKHIQVRLCSRKVFESLGVYRTKTVFTKIYEIMDPAIFLYEGKQLIVLTSSLEQQQCSRSEAFDGFVKFEIERF